MREWLLSLVPSGIEIMLVVQQWRTPLWDALMNVITNLGSEEFFIVLIPLLFWCVDKSLVVGLSYAYLTIVYVNTTLKTIFAIPRPYTAAFQDWNSTLVPLRHEETFSWPSGHAQGAVGVYGYLALVLKKAWFWVLGGGIVLLIAFSRIYLGVHTPFDVVSGLFFGGLLLAIWVWVEPRGASRLQRWAFAWQLGLAVAVPFLLLLLVPSKESATSMGALLGLGIGALLERRYIRFDVKGVWWKRVLRGIVGLVILLSIYLGLRALSPDIDIHWLMITLRFLRYAFLGVLMMAALPQLFLWMRLADREEKA